MIEWKRYPDYQPPSHSQCLVTNGKWFKIADHALRYKRGSKTKGYKWEAVDGVLLDGVTHFALINNPPPPCSDCGGAGGYEHGTGPTGGWYTCQNCDGTGNEPEEGQAI